MKDYFGRAATQGFARVRLYTRAAQNIFALLQAAHLHFDPPDAYPPEKAWMTAAKRQPLQENTLTPAQEYVVGWLREEGESGRKELMENRGERSEGYVDKAIHELRQMGLIERVNEGGMGKAAIYRLVEQEIEV